MQEITLTKPDDWHVHLRDGVVLQQTVNDTANRFARAIVMPNLKIPVTTLKLATAYHQRILQINPNFKPLMTLYLTDNTKPQDIETAKNSGLIYAAKLYPAGATTHSDQGVTGLENIAKTLLAMQECQMPLLIHAEVTDPNVDIFDREREFIDRHITKLLTNFPKLKIILEHITTKYAAEFVATAPKNLAATITAHHLLCDRNDMLAGGIKPHYYCLPVLKRRSDRQALLLAATSGNHKFFLGTDSAPHPKQHKESACGCAGIYTAHAALELYAEAFASMQALDKLAGFAAVHGADFYGLPRNHEQITLQQKTWKVAVELNFAKDKLIPFRAGKEIHWQIA